MSATATQTQTVTNQLQVTASPSAAPPSTTTSTFKYLDTSTIKADIKPWSKVDGGGVSYKLADHQRPVHNIRGYENEFSIDKSGFAVYKYPAAEKSFRDDKAVREGYYGEIEQLIKDKLPGVKKVVIFDHTIRRREKNSPRQPVQQVHVDQTPAAAEARVRRHLPADEAEELLKGHYQLVNIWRPIENPATDFPLAVIDWRTTTPEDFIPVDLLYPKRAEGEDDIDDRGKEALPLEHSNTSTEGYQAKGETFGVAPSDKHKFYYYKDMTPEEVMFIKCFDSDSETLKGNKGIAHATPHTAFIDPQTPENAPGRQSIEARTLIFYE